MEQLSLFVQLDHCSKGMPRFADFAKYFWHLVINFFIHLFGIAEEQIVWLQGNRGYVD